MRILACPYEDCTFEGTQKQVDDHCTYMVRVDDPDHRIEKLREQRDR